MLTVLKQWMMVILVMLLALLTGCDKVLILHPINKKDIVRIKAGQEFVPEIDGYFLSDFYVKEVMDAKVRE